MKLPQEIEDKLARLGPVPTELLEVIRHIAERAFELGYCQAADEMEEI